jgi:hypothetical protein
MRRVELPDEETRKAMLTIWSLDIYLDEEPRGKADMVTLLPELTCIPIQLIATHSGVVECMAGLAFPAITT